MPIIFSVSTALIALRKKGVSARPQGNDGYVVSMAGKEYLLNSQDIKTLAGRINNFPHLTQDDIHQYLQKHSLK